jgi:hypothetical protein
VFEGCNFEIFHRTCFSHLIGNIFYILHYIPVSLYRCLINNKCYTRVVFIRITFEYKKHLKIAKG